MDIKQLLSGNNTPNENFNKLFCNIHSIKELSFELELPGSNSFGELMESTGQSQAQVNKPDLNKEIDDIEAKLLKSLQDLATKDKVPFKTRNINNIKLLIHTQDLLSKKNKSELGLDSLDKIDFDFLKELSNNQNLIMLPINMQNSQINLAIPDQSGYVSYKSFNISKNLCNLIEYAYKNQKPIRLDFESNSSVILRIDKQGKLSAEFISSNKAMEFILKNSIPHLKNKLDLEGIQYKEVIYKDNTKKQNNSNSDQC